MKPVFDRPQMVRGVIVVGSRWDGMVSIDNDNCAVARTLWYRHDGDIDRLERELNSLLRMYMSNPDCDGAGMHFEYKDYEEV